MQNFSRTFPQTQALIEEGLTEGLHVGAQVYISLDGKVLADHAVGESRPGVAMTPETVTLWLSACKPIAAVATLQLCERGKLTLDDPVSRHVPEFGQGGKEAITVRQLLTHTGGFRDAQGGWPETDWPTIIDHICRSPIEPGWIPGAKAGYHRQSSWYMLGELVRRLDGRFYADYVREEIFLPLGMRNTWVGMPPEQYDAYGERLGWLLQTDQPARPPYHWSTKAGATHCSPGATGHGPVRELGWLYEALLGRGERQGVRILQPESVELMTSRQRVGMFDHTFMHVIDWGLGMIVDSNRYGPDTVPYGYGRHSSESTFGHGGSQSSIGFCDPENRLVVAIVFNGMCGERKHNRRNREVNTAIYEDLGLAKQKSQETSNGG